MNKYVFTFGFGQPHANGYHVIYANTEDEACEQMNQRFGERWSMVYGSELEDGVEKFGLKEIK